MRTLHTAHANENGYSLSVRDDISFSFVPSGRPVTKNNESHCIDTAENAALSIKLGLIVQGHLRASCQIRSMKIDMCWFV